MTNWCRLGGFRETKDHDLEAFGKFDRNHTQRDLGVGRTIVGRGIYERRFTSNCYE